MLTELDHPNVGVNFDPANMILYGMGDPLEAIRVLASSVVQIHVKDATRRKHLARGARSASGVGGRPLV